MLKRITEIVNISFSPYHCRCSILIIHVMTFPIVLLVIIVVFSGFPPYVFKHPTEHCMYILWCLFLLNMKIRTQRSLHLPSKDYICMFWHVFYKKWMLAWLNQRIYVSLKCMCIIIIEADSYTVTYFSSNVAKTGGVGADIKITLKATVAFIALENLSTKLKLSPNLKYFPVTLMSNQYWCMHQKQGNS